MDPFELRQISDTDISVTCFGFGGASMGNMYTVAHDDQALMAIRAAYEAKVRYFDTAPMYGFGKSERLYGCVLNDKPRDSFVLSTKAGRLIVAGEPTPESEETCFVEINDAHAVFDYSRDGVLRSLEESRERLGIDKIDIVYIHDPDVQDCFQEALDEAFPTLAELKSQGIIGAIGAGMNQAEMLCDFAKNADFDCFLLAGRYTLLDQIALEELLPLCQQKNISIIIGGAYNSGILATGAIKGAHYNYELAPPDIMEKTRKIETVCSRFNVSMKAAALQFPFGHPAVVSNIPGVKTKERFEENLSLFRDPIPADFWTALKEENLLVAEAPVPNSSAG
jgi:D-threo-aldose 1-dehydrogenase